MVKHKSSGERTATCSLGYWIGRLTCHFALFCNRPHRRSTRMQAPNLSGPGRPGAGGEAWLKVISASNHAKSKLT